MFKSPVRQVEGIVRRYCGGYLPVDPLHIAKCLNVTARSDAGLNDTRSGQLIVAIGYEDSKPVIAYNPHYHLNQLRLGIAHALGHYVLGHLHPDKPNNLHLDNIDTIHDSTTGSMNTAATEFALAVLMPSDIVHHLFRHEIDTVEGFSERFQLSTRAVSLRLQHLGYLPPLGV